MLWRRPRRCAPRRSLSAWPARSRGAARVGTHHYNTHYKRIVKNFCTSRVQIKGCCGRDHAVAPRVGVFAPLGLCGFPIYYIILYCIIFYRLCYIHRAVAPRVGVLARGQPEPEEQRAEPRVVRGQQPFHERRSVCRLCKRVLFTYGILRFVPVTGVVGPSRRN